MQTKRDKGENEKIYKNGEGIVVAFFSLNIHPIPNSRATQGRGVLNEVLS